MSDKNKPVHEIRYGTVKVLVWKNTTDKGAMFSVTTGRLYKDGNAWKTSSSFNTEDLPTLTKALSDAHSWIHEHTDKKAVE